MIRVAIFSDIHGKILLPFKLVDLYQKETGQSVDLILQCGDMGAYPHLENLDKATIKHAKNDRDELGFHDDFVKANPVIQQFLNDLDLDMVCVRGNHEDHDYIDSIEQMQGQGSIFPIDVYERVWVCKSGMPQTFKKGNLSLDFVGIGRIGDRKGRSEKRFIQDYERRLVKKLHKTKGQFDVLITHDKDDSSQRGYGMAEIRELLDEIPFLYHFYGHTGEPFSQSIDSNGITQSVKVKECEFEDSGILPQGCMLILEKMDTGELRLEVVAQSLTNKLSKYNWRF